MLLPLAGLLVPAITEIVKSNNSRSIPVAPSQFAVRDNHVYVQVHTYHIHNYGQPAAPAPRTIDAINAEVVDEATTKFNRDVEDRVATIRREMDARYGTVESKFKNLFAEEVAAPGPMEQRMIGIFGANPTSKEARNAIKLAREMDTMRAELESKGLLKPR